MDSMLKKIMERKGNKKPLSPVEKDAKMSVVEEMRKMAQEAMGDKLKGLKKVTVASNDPEGLEEGLDKAKDLIGEMPKEDEEGSEDEMSELSPEDAHKAEEEMSMSDDDSDSDMSEDDLDAKIQKLMELKKLKEKVRI